MKHQFKQPKWQRRKMRECAMAWRKVGGLHNLDAALYWRDGAQWPAPNWYERILRAKGFTQ